MENMNHVLRHVRVIDPGGPYQDQEVDIWVKNGKVAKVGARIAGGEAHEVKHPGAHVSPGWVDLRAHFRDPGEEYKEGIRNGLDATAAGGFTAVAVLPSTEPPVDSASGVEYLLRKSQGHAVTLVPLGAITKGLKGEQLAELDDLRRAGAAAFTDDQHTVRNTRLMSLALQYARGIEGTIMSFPHDGDLAVGGQMHEGPMSVRLGMKGIPPEAESILVQRDLELLAYAGGRLHLSTISTARSVELVREAKARKLNVTASVAAHHLLLDDGCLRGFETNYKVLPPLRDEAHIEALRNGVKDGTIDAVVSDHRPEDVEHKKLEFGLAAFGTIGLETSYAAANTALHGRMNTRRIVERLCHGPRTILGMTVPHIVEGAPAEITLFDPEVNWTFTSADIVSRSHNTPFIGQRFTGRPLGIVANGKVALAAALMEGVLK
jgi:dihydroorotase